MKIEREDAKNVKKRHVQTTAVHWILWAKNDWSCDRSIHFMSNLRPHEKNTII